MSMVPSDYLTDMQTYLDLRAREAARWENVIKASAQLAQQSLQGTAAHIHTCKSEPWLHVTHKDGPSKCY